ncbi:uncharacterized protein METZ01_LOCUS2024, partial [marine metagenome]
MVGFPDTMEEASQFDENDSQGILQS